nr:glycine--tRNA ligase [Microcella frigidaquae]
MPYVLLGPGHPARAEQENPTVAAPSRLDKVIALAKRRGFVFQAGEIYGGSRSAWDYGPLGVELKENIKRQWWRSMVTRRDDVVGLDSSVILPKRVWEASGHVEVFSDPLVECLSCHKRYRADHLEEEFEEKKGRAPEGGLAEIACANCGTRGQWTEPKEFSGLLKTYLGPVDDESGLHYLRPETAQGIFVNFANVLNAARMKPPFGIGQIGKSFRNEITPGNFIFRTREFEQMEMEFFVEPGTDEEWHQYWIDTRLQWYVDLGVNPENLRLYEHPAEKLSHYSKRTVDIEYRFGFSGSEFGELEGIANRTDFDLSTHSQHSGVDLSYFDQSKEERWTPYVIEPAAGLTRSLMAFLVDAYYEDEAPNTKGGVDVRTVLRLDRRLAPVKAAVLPLSRNEQLSPVARELADRLRQHWNVDFDDAGAIGRRYRRQDEIGTPFCVTVDFDTLDDQAVTVRERDTMAQERIPLSTLEGYLAGHLLGA